MHRSLLPAVLSLSLLLSTLVAAQDASYTFTTIDVPGAPITVALGINDNGQIVGWFFSPAETNGFLTDGGTFTPIDVPGAPDTWANGINAAGQIVGGFQDASISVHGFVATPDTIPPVLTVSASPDTLWPPTGQLVAVTVSGTIIDEPDSSEVSSAAYQITDEYGQIQPSGTFTPGAAGRYAFTVDLQASRTGNDQDGRRYTITVSATDQAGNRGDALTLVTVPHG